MFFPIPDPALWDDPGQIPYNRLARLLGGNKFYPSRPQWTAQYQRWQEKQAELAEETARYERELADRQASLAEYQEQGEVMAERLPLYLHNLCLSHWRKEIEKKTDRWADKIDYCLIDGWMFDESSYYFHISTSPLPYGLKIPMFLDQGIADTLSANFYSKTWVEYNGHEQRPGLWVIVEHRAGRGLLPKYVEYSHALKALPKTAPPLAWVVGIGANNKATIANIGEIYTVLISGQKNSGKSNVINCAICTWIQRAQPAHLRLFLTDLKGALEFYNYNGIPHLGGDVDIKMRIKKDGPLEKVRLGQEVLSEPYQVVPVLKYLEAEMARRQNLMKGKAKNIYTYNKKSKKKLSWWVLVIDELATLADSPVHKEAYASLAELVRKGRAVGVCCVLATQIPDKTVITRQIAGNMDFRIVGYLADGNSSGLTLGDGTWDAVRLPTDIRGRMIARWNTKRVVQVPFISEMVSNRIINAVKHGDAASIEETEETAIAQELFSYSLDNLDGLCPQNGLFNHFRNLIPQHRIKTVLKSYEITQTENGLEPVIQLGDDEFYLLPARPDGNNGQYPRQLVTVEEFERQKGTWLEIIQFRSRQTVNGNGNGRRVTGGNLKPAETSPVDEPLFIYEPGGPQAGEDDKEEIETPDDDSLLPFAPPEISTPLPEVALDEW